jgi:hypothetical protein
MILHIADHLRVSDVQDKFSLCFPGLQILFYDNMTTMKKYPQKGVGGMELLENIRNEHEHGELEIKSWFTAGLVETRFWKEFGLLVAIFKWKAGKWQRLSFNEVLAPTLKTRCWSV